jgi:hypothetical protein
MLSYRVTSRVAKISGYMIVIWSTSLRQGRSICYLPCRSEVDPARRKFLLNRRCLTSLLHSPRLRLEAKISGSLLLTLLGGLGWFIINASDSDVKVRPEFCLCVHLGVSPEQLGAMLLAAEIFSPQEDIRPRLARRAQPRKGRRARAPPPPPAAAAATAADGAAAAADGADSARCAKRAAELAAAHAAARARAQHLSLVLERRVVRRRRRARVGCAAAHAFLWNTPAPPARRCATRGAAAELRAGGPAFSRAGGAPRSYARARPTLVEVSKVFKNQPRWVGAMLPELHEVYMEQ